MRLIFTILVCLNSIYLKAQLHSPEQPEAISFTLQNLSYSQDFNKNNIDGLKASPGVFADLPKGWAFAEIGDAGGLQLDGKYRAGSGTSTVADTYSFGSSFNDKDRSLGSITSPKLIKISLGCLFINNSGKTITQLHITYHGKQWRNGGSEKPNKMIFAYSTDASSLLNGTWQHVKELDFSSPQSGPNPIQLNGNDPDNKATLKFTISGLSIPNNSKFWIRWENENQGGKGDGLAIDDINILTTTNK